MRPRSGAAIGGVPLYAGAGNACCWQLSALRYGEAGETGAPVGDAFVTAWIAAAARSTYGTAAEISVPFTRRGNALHWFVTMTPVKMPVVGEYERLRVL